MKIKVFIWLFILSCFAPLGATNSTIELDKSPSILILELNSNLECYSQFNSNEIFKINLNFNDESPGQRTLEIWKEVKAKSYVDVKTADCQFNEKSEELICKWDTGGKLKIMFSKFLVTNTSYLDSEVFFSGIYTPNIFYPWLDLKCKALTKPTVME